MKPLKLSLVLQLLVIFVSGAVVGALGHRFYSRQQSTSTMKERPKGGDRRGDLRRGYVEAMRSRLKLTDQQVRKLNEISDTTDRRVAEVRKRVEADPTVQAGFAKHKELWDASSPELEAIGKDQSAQILAMLSPEQRVEYEKLLKERAAGKRRGGRGEGAPPPDRRGGRPGGPPGYRP